MGYQRRVHGIPANACWLNSLANQEVYILNHSNIIYKHTMKLKCEMCPQDATFVVGCGNKTACSRCVTTRKCNPSRERAIEITQQDAKEMPCDICKSNPVSVVCLEDRAFLCTDCDLKIHSANDFAGHHQRFAFTNAKMAIPEGVSKEKPEVPEHVPIAIRTNKRKNIAQNNNTENNNNTTKSHPRRKSNISSTKTAAWFRNTFRVSSSKRTTSTRSCTLRWTPGLNCSRLPQIRRT